MPTSRSAYVNLIYFYGEDISSFWITTSEKVDAILLKASKVIETTVQKHLKSDLVDQLSEIDDIKSFFEKNLKFKDKNESNQKD